MRTLAAFCHAESRDRNSPLPAAREHPLRLSYGGRWRAVPRELGFLLLTFPLAVLSFTVVLTLFTTGLSTVAIFVGVFLIIAALVVARGFGTLEMNRLEWAGRPPIPRPAWAAPTDRPGFWAALLRMLGNGHYWLHLLHAMVVNFAVSIFSWVVTVVWVSVAVGGLTSWIWQRIGSAQPGDFWLYRVVLGAVVPGAMPAVDTVVPPVVGETIFQFLVGALFLALLPFITRGLTLLHDVIARAMLGAWRSEFLHRAARERGETLRSDGRGATHHAATGHRQWWPLARPHGYR